MGKLKQVRMCGLGGQGIILAGTVLGHAAILDGKWVAASNHYGAAARGGTCRAEVVISEERIVYPLVIKADILIAMSQSAYELYIEDVKVQGGIVIYDAQLVTPRDVVGLKQIGIPATSKVIEEFDNKQIANMAMLGATVKLTGVVSSSALVAAVETNVESTYRVLNLKAVESGLKLGEMANKNGSRR